MFANMRSDVKKVLLGRQLGGPNLSIATMRRWLVIGVLAIIPFSIQARPAQQHKEETKQVPRTPIPAIPAISQPTATPEKPCATTEPKHSRFDWLWPPLISNWPLVVIGIAGIWAALKTLAAIKRQADIMQKELVIASRAYLAVGEPEKTVSGEVRIPIENRGRVSAKILGIEITILVHKVADGRTGEIYRRSIKPEIHEEAIVPGDPHFSLFVHLPEIAKDIDSQITVAGDVKYDIGFSGSVDTLKFLRSFSVKYNAWMKGWNGIDADFREPTNSEKQN